MNSSHPFPIFLSLSDRRCIVCGLGHVGARKMEALLVCGANRILALDTRAPAELSPQMRLLLSEGGVTFAKRRFMEADAQGALLVFAATSDPRENDRIAALCRQHGALCNCVTDLEASDFILPATARRGALCAALSTAGQSPMLARKWRLELEDWLKPREKLAWLLGRLRGPILALGKAQACNAALFRRIADSPVPHWLEHDETENCRKWLLTELPASLSAEINKIFTEYAAIFA